MRCFSAEVSLFFLMYACIPIKDPNDLAGDSDRPFTPEIDDFSITDNAILEGPPDSGEEQESGLTPNPAAAELNLVVNGNTLLVNHRYLSLSCNFDLALDVTFSNNTFTASYTTETGTDCQYEIEYTIDITGLPSGTYSYVAHGNTSSFTY